MFQAEIKGLVNRVKKGQARFNKLVNGGEWIEDAKRYAEKQGKEVQKLFRSDIRKVQTFLEKEKKQLEKYQRQIPGEIKKISSYVKTQRKEIEKLLARASQVGAKKTKRAAPKKKPTRRKTASNNA